MHDILIIDDESKLLEVLQKVLEREGYTVLTSSSGEEGIKIFKKMQPKLVITDILMPDMDGIELIENIKQENDSQKIIIMSGGSRNLAADFVLTLGVGFGGDATLTKPFSIEDLIEAVVGIIGTAAKRDDI
ncbi:MAG: response regulator [Magnetococcales bacterium]|nr:response regulator [Magnetococcales bacterium]